MSIDRRRGYIRVTEQPDSIFERWSLPAYELNNASPKETALNYDPSWEAPKVAEEPVESEIDFKMLRPDALEHIRHSAYEEGKKEGYDKGFTEGREAGFKEGKIAGLDTGQKEGLEQGLLEGQLLVENRCQHLDAILEKITFPLVQVDHQVYQQVLEIVIQLTKTAIQTEVVTNPNVILATLQKSITALPMSGRQAIIYLHPEDIEVVTNVHSAESIKDYQWKFIPKPSINRGDIQIFCGDSIVDYRMKDRIQQLLSRFASQNITRELDCSEGGDGVDILRTIDIDSLSSNCDDHEVNMHAEDSSQEQSKSKNNPKIEI
ncbi:flagellar assembly protein FliH [Candidatus Enterovibrio altilux]|uniref:Flagellar assembly protein FliH n=2 Tax=Candidatus Enterovibrio altilux TaxID=1927128 RepID=A0A291B874_9GAMM|nr:flagellar assembly protein FliH [Candidatus Enterovibrio luxaltus]ATF09202.1 Flagellar assembly protein FliH [Candidatus Enterovibrio luxaltus]